MAREKGKPQVTIEPTVLNVVTTAETDTPKAEEKVTEDKVAEKVAEVTVEVQVPLKGEKLVKIKPNATFRVFIGDRFHNFTKGEVVSVPQNVKDILMKQGALDAI